MCRFGMVNNNKCDRCEGIETTKHLLWECLDSKKIWDLFNVWIVNQSLTPLQISKYKDIFWVDDNARVCKVKIKIMHEMVQIIRLTMWNIKMIKYISIDIAEIESYGRKIQN